MTDSEKKRKAALYDARRGSARERVTDANPAHGNSKLIPVRKTVRKKNGMTYQQTFWVNPEEAEKMKKEDPAVQVGAASGGAGNSEGYAGGYYGNVWGGDPAASSFLIRLMEAAKKEEPERFEKLKETDSRTSISSVSGQEFSRVEDFVTRRWEREPFYKLKSVFRFSEEVSGEAGFWGGTACDVISLIGHGGLVNPVWLTDRTDDACGMCAKSGAWEHGDLFQAGFSEMRVILILSGDYGESWSKPEFMRRNGKVPGNISRFVNRGRIWVCQAKPMYILEFE